MEHFFILIHYPYPPQLDRYERRVLSREHPLAVSYKRSVARTLFIVVIVFVVLRLPFTILVVLRAKYFTTDASVDSGMLFFWYFSQYLMFANAAVNPLIYGFNNESFRRAYAQISCIKRRRQEARSHSRVHHCWYCEFIKRRRGANGKETQNKDTISTAKETKRLDETSQLSVTLHAANDLQLSQIDGEGFI